MEFVYAITIFGAVFTAYIYLTDKKKPKIILTVIKEDTGYSATANIGNKFIATEGETLEELKTKALEAVNLSIEDRGIIYNEEEIILKPA